MKILDATQTRFFDSFFALFALGLIMLWVKDILHIDKCRPYSPTGQCQLGKYEIRIHNIIDCKIKQCGETIAVAEGPCVKLIDYGTWKVYQMPEAKWHSRNHEDYFESGFEVSVEQSYVCRIS